MILTKNIILLIFLCVTNTWTHSQVELESNNLNEDDTGVKSLDNNDVYSSLLKNNLRDGKRVRVQLYYEVMDPDSVFFYVSQFWHVIRHFLPYVDISIYPFGNAKIENDNDMVKFECSHGPEECYGNKLHACSLDSLNQLTSLIFNLCLMSPIEDGSFGSDDVTADRCGKVMNFDPKPIKDCAKETRGTELMLYYGELSKRANFSYVPHLLINGKVSSTVAGKFRDQICAAFIHPPPLCETGISHLGL